jgi:cation:H+ antiporter
VLLAAFLLAWAAEASQFVVSQGVALAALAWLQTMPEFSIEGVIAWNAGKGLLAPTLMTANFTGAIRLLVGLGWPMVFVVRALSTGHGVRGFFKASIHLEEEHSVEVLAVLPPMAWFLLILAKGSLTVLDAAVLLGLYAGYFWLVSRVPSREHEEMDDLPRVSRWVLTRPGRWKVMAALGLFVVGGALLYFSAGPFVGSLQGLAVLLGIPAFIFVQWVAPLLSEFPEKVSAFYWARTVKKAPMAMMNMLSSNINEWTVLAALIPIVYSMAQGHPSPVVFDHQQRLEIALTLAQSLLGFFFLVNMEFRWHEACGLFVLWFIQFVRPGWHVPVTAAYLAWALLELALLITGRRKWIAFSAFLREWRRHSVPRPRRA